MTKPTKPIKHKCLVCGKVLPNKTKYDKKRKYCSVKCMGMAYSNIYKWTHKNPYEKTRLEEENKISDTKKNK